MLILLKYLHIIGAIVLVGSVFTIDLMTLRLVLAKRNPQLKVFYIESKFIERAIIGPSSLLTLISGVIMAFLWFGWPFWLVWGLVVIGFTGFTGTVTIPKMKKKLVDLIEQNPANAPETKRLSTRFILSITIDVLLLISAVGTMVYKPNF